MSKSLAEPEIPNKRSRVQLKFSNIDIKTKRNKASMVCKNLPHRLDLLFFVTRAGVATVDDFWAISSIVCTMFFHFILLIVLDCIMLLCCESGWMSVIPLMCNKRKHLAIVVDEIRLSVVCQVGGFCSGLTLAIFVRCPLDVWESFVFDTTAAKNGKVGHLEMADSGMKELETFFSILFEYMCFSGQFEGMALLYLKKRQYCLKEDYFATVEMILCVPGSKNTSDQSRNVFTIDRLALFYLTCFDMGEKNNKGANFFPWLVAGIDYTFMEKIGSFQTN
ncbi:unnamed protein product [Enterobius vermicularis]|uniref:Pentatricopeptide repeat-containing protein n=1 Tax=Enterobius vermicularis TaxID=51028 RepID=A0A0N4UVC9_ENTVE|nr:unnamed protein product [Enterobius vermicularis]